MLFWNNHSPDKTEYAQTIGMPPEAPTDGKNTNLFNLGVEFFEIGFIKIGFLCFLQTENIAVGFLNFASNRFPFDIRVNTSDVPTKNFPLLIH